ncbi:MAG: M28 family metallopeptidase [Solirubrobacteraceae bacterium]
MFSDHVRRRVVVVLALQVVLVAGLVAVALALTGPSKTSGPVPAARAGHFDARSAYRLAALQVRSGQRPAGSPQLRRLAAELRPKLPGGHFEAIPGAPKLRNVVGTLAGRRPAIVVGAHYDTLVKPAGFVGANNGAAGSAIVVQLARDLARLKRPANARAVRFVLFDGEEPDAGLPEEQTDFYATGLRGSRADAKRNARTTKAMILLDYVGNRGLRLPREGTSNTALWARLSGAARTAGVGAVFPGATGPAIIDDHTPYLRAGVPAVDLIDWSYPGHQKSDTLDKLSARSMDAVGEAVLGLVQDLRTR